MNKIGGASAYVTTSISLWRRLSLRREFSIGWIQLPIFPLFEVHYSSCIYLDDLCFIRGLFLLQHPMNTYIDVWMGTSTHSVENVVPSFRWVGGSWAVTIRVVPELKMSLQSLKRKAAAVLSSLSSKTWNHISQIDEWVQERGRQLVSQVDEGCQVLTKFSRWGHSSGRSSKHTA